jgi:hypothetical protein
MDRKDAAIDRKRVNAAFTLLAVLTCLGGCTEMPILVPYGPQGQKALTSARHWEAIAADIESNIDKPVDGERGPASGHDILSVGTNNTGKCVILRTGAPGTQSDFQDLLRDSLIRRFIANSWTVYAVNGDGPGPMTGGEGKAPHPQCEFVKIDSVVIMHKGTDPQPIPGQWTLLTAGALVVRHVVHEAFRNINVIGTAALAEGGWWATSGLRGRGKMGELAVTVSRASWPDPDATEYLAEFTNVYYFRADDVRLYQSHNVQTHPIENPNTIADVGRPSERVDCPLPDPAQEQRDSTDKCRPPTNAAVMREVTIDVSPKTISKCIKTAEFTIAGRGLIVDKNNYELGTVPAIGFEPAGLTTLGTDDYGRVRQAIHVKFAGLQDANQGLDSVPFTVTTQNGVYVAAVSVGGTCPPTDSAKKGTSPQTPALTLSPAEGKAADVCKSPLQVIVGGSGAQAIKSASIWKGHWSSEREPAADGKTVKFNFKQGPTFSKDSFPRNLTKLDIDLLGDANKTVTKTLPVTCGS